MLRMENLSSKIFPSFTEGPLSPLSPSMPPLCLVIAQIQLPHVCLHISPIYLGSLDPTLPPPRPITILLADRNSMAVQWLTPQ